MDDNRKEVVRKAILLLSADQFTQKGEPDVSELNAAMPEGSAPVSAKERTEIWQEMVEEREKAASTLPEAPPTPPEPEAEEPVIDNGMVLIRVIKANGNPFDLRVNGRVVARLITGQKTNFPRAYLPALDDTDTKYEEVH